MSARERTYALTNFHLFDETMAEGFYQMPTIRKSDYIPSSLIGFNYAKTESRTDCGVHFFVDDYQFERVWNEPERNIERLKKFPCVLTPDWSMYMDMPMALKVWNSFRRQLIGQIWQNAGLTVIPTLSWAEPETYKFCFDGIEKGGTVAVSTVGVVRHKDARAVWIDGMREALKRIEPKTVVCYGPKIDFDFGKTNVVYFDGYRFKERNG